MDINKLLSWGNDVTGQTLGELKAQDATLRNQQALVQAATASNYARLRAERLAVQERQQQMEQRYQEQDSWWIKPSDIAVNREGLPGVITNLGNTALGVVDGTTRLASTAIGGLFELDASMKGLFVPDDVKQAYGRLQQNKATAQDMKLLEQKGPVTMQRLIPRSYKETLDDIYKAREYATIFVGDSKKGKEGLLATDMYNEYHRDARNAQLKELNDAVDREYFGRIGVRPEELEGLSPTERFKLLRSRGQDALNYAVEIGKNTAKASFDNPWSIAGDVAESLPNVAVPLLGAAAYTLGNRTNSMNDYIERNGSLPSLNDDAKMTAISVADFGLNYLENIIPAKTLGLGAKAGKASVASAGKVSVDDAVKQLKGLAGKATALAGATVAEGVAEGLQSGIQSGWGSLQAASLRDIVEGGVQGGLAGGAMSGGAFAVGYAGEAGAAAAQATSNQFDKFQKAKEAKKDYNTLINPESEFFDPAQAVNTQVAAFNAEGATEEQKTEAKTKMDEAIKVAEDVYGQKEADLQTAIQNTESLITPVQDEIEAIQQALDNATEPDEIAEIKEDLKTAQSELKRYEDTKAKYEDELQKLQTSRQAVYDARDRFADQEAALTGDVDTPEAIQKTVDTLKATPESVDPAELQKAVTKFKKNPMMVKPEDALAIVDNPNNGLTDSERVSIRRLAEQQIALNRHKDNNTVSREIVEGGKGFRGLNEYSREVTKALGQDRVKQADRFLSELDNFKTSYVGKAAVAAAALKESTKILQDWKAKNPGQEAPEGIAQLQIYKDQKNGQWKINRGEVTIPDEKRGEFGALYVNAAAPKSRQLVSQIQEDAVQVVNAHQVLGDMRKAYTPAGSQTGSSTSKKQTPTKPSQKSKPEATPSSQPSATEININAGTGDNVQLSNFAKRKFEANGQKFFSVEQAFHFAKAKAVGRDDIAQQVMKTFKGGELRKLTSPRNMKLDKEQRAKWDGMSENVLYKLMKASFEQDAAARKALLDTEDAVLTHKYKGVEQDNGRFSRVLMKIREELRQDSSESAQIAPDSTETPQPIESIKVDPKEAENALQRESEEGTGKGRAEIFQGVSAKDRQAEEKVPFLQRNLVKASFVQKIGKGFLNPLVEVKDFISNIMAVENPEKYLKDYYKKEIDDKQVEHFKNFAKYTQRFTRDFNKAFLYNGKNPDWFHTDYMQFLAKPNSDGSVSFDENIVTAMAHAAFTWTAENANTPWATDDSILENIFHFDNVEAMRASPNIRREFRLTQSFTALASEIGAKALQALNIQLDTSLDIDPNRKHKLESSMGAYIIHAMEYQGILKVAEYTDKDMAGFAKELGETRYNEYLSNQLGMPIEGTRDLWNEETLKAVEAFEKSTKVNQKFVNIQRTAKGEVPSFAEKIVESAQGTRGFLSELFGVQPYNRVPALEKPEAFSQEKIKNTSAEVPSAQAELLNKAQQHPQRIRTETLDPIVHLFSNHNKEFLHLFDLRTDENWMMKNFHKNERDSVIAKRQGVLRNLNLALEFARDYLKREGDEYQPFYTEFEVWMPQRMGVKNNMMNTQANTVHRALATPADYKMTLTAPKVADGQDRGEALLAASFNADGSLTSLGRLLRAIAEGAEDMKVKGVPSHYLRPSFDKVRPGDYLPAFISWMESPETQKAIEATSKLRQLAKDGEPVPKEVFQNIKPVLDQMGTGFMEFNSLVALSELYDAVNAGGKEFTTYMRAGSDGVTSGSAISHLATATVDASTGTNDMAHGFGLITKEAHENMDVNDVFDLHAQGSKDIYQTVNKFQNARWFQVFSGQSGLMTDAFVNDLLGQLYGAMNNFYDDFNDRSKGKDSATPTIYGSSAGAIKANVADKAVTQIYTTMRKLQKTFRTDPEKAKELGAQYTDDLNRMLQYYNWMMTPAKPDTFINTKYKNQDGKMVSALEFFGPKMEAEYNMNNPDAPISFVDMDTRSFLIAYSRYRKPEGKTDNQLWYAAIKKYNASRMGNKQVDYLKPDFMNPSKGLLELDLPAEVEDAINKVAYSVHGKVHELGLQDAYADYLQIRNVDVAMIDVGFTIYKEIKDQLMREALDRAMDPDAPGPKVAYRVDKQGNKIPLENLPPSVLKQIEKELYSVRPMLASALSTQSKDPLGTGLMMSKQTERFMSDSQHRIQVQAQGPEKKMTSQLGTRDRTDGNPGVLGAVIPVLSTDARVAANALALDFATEDMHDSNYSNPDKAGEMGQFQNKQLHDSIVTYHMQLEKLNVMMRGLEAWTSGKYVVSEEANQRILDKLQAVHNKFYKELPYDERPSLDQMIPELVNNRHYMELRKIDQFNNYYAIHHYGAESGQYVLGETDAQLRKEERDKVAKAIMKGGRASQRAKTVASGLSKIIDTGVQRVREDIVAEQQAALSDPNRTERFLESKRDKPFKAKDLVRHLQKDMKSLAGKQLLDVIVKLLPDGTKVNYFNQDNVPEGIDAKEMIEKGAAAWYDPNTNQINILDSASENGIVTAETVLHELLHAATSHAILLVEAGKGTPEMRDAVQRLEELRKEVLERMSEDARKNYRNELSDVNELIAYGLSNKPFQQLLASTMVRRGKRKLTSLFKEFVTNMLDLVFGIDQRSNHRKQIPAFEALVLEFGNLAQSVEEMGKDTLAKEIEGVKGEALAIMSAQRNAQGRVDAMRTTDLFEALDGGNTSDAFTARGLGLIETVVDAVMDRRGRKPILEAMMKQQTHADTARNAGFAMSDREAFLTEALEATIEAALDNGAGTNIYKVFNAVHAEARKSLSPQSFFDGDWTTATPQDKALAQAKFDYLFKPETTQGRNKMIARFASLVLGTESMYDKLGFAVPEQAKQDKPLMGKIADAVDAAIAWVMNWMAGVKHSDNLNTKVNELAERMAAIDTKYRIKVVGQFEKLYYRMMSILGKTNTLTGTLVGKFAESEKVSKSENRLLKTLGVAARVAVSDKQGEIVDFFKAMRNYENPNTRYGLIAESLREFEGAEGFTKFLHKLFRATKQIETIRADKKSGVMQSVTKAFGYKLSDEENKGLSYGLLRSGAHVLMDDYTVTEMRNLIGQADVRKKAIDDLTNRIKAHKDYRARMIIRAKQLGWFTQSENPTPGLVLNALAIVQGVGSPSFKGELKEADPDLVKMIDQLATLYGFEYMTQANRKAVLNVMTNEVRRRDVKTNGVEFMLGIHRDLAREASESLFADNPLSMVKGWLPDITNQYVRVQNFPMSQKAELEKKGWVYVAPVKTDAADFNQANYGMFKWDNIGNTRRVSGALSLTDTHSKGTVISNGADGDFTGTIKANLSGLVRKNEMIDPDAYDPRKDHTTQLFANFDTEGNVMNYSYRMNAHTRDALLERKHDVAELLGEYTGNMFDKLHSPEQNKRVMEALHADFTVNFAKNPNAYVAIGPRVADPGAQELWRLLPYKTRKDMENLWGKGKPMYVRNDLVSTVFGFKKIAMGNLWNKAESERNAIEKTYALIMEGMFKEKAQLWSYRLGAGWAELVKNAKDWIVLRTGNVLVGNVKFNTVLLTAYGIAPTAIIRDSAIAFRAGKAYREDMQELMQIEAQLRAGAGNRTELEYRYAQLQDSLARNPLRDFIESGTMPTIVDDVEINEDDYSYKSEAGKKLKKYTDVVPEGVKTVGKTALMSPGTIGHNFMSAATQYSDFMARYVVYNHARKKEGMSHDDAVQEAMQMFIQYDLPSSPQVQWLNDSGLMMFTKFLFRFQHVMMKVFRKNPAFVMLQSFGLNLLTDPETLLDPNLISKAPSMFYPGPLALPSAIGGSTPMNVVF